MPFNIIQTEIAKTTLTFIISLSDSMNIQTQENKFSFSSFSPKSVIISNASNDDGHIYFDVF